MGLGSGHTAMHPCFFISQNSDGEEKNVVALEVPSTIVSKLAFGIGSHAARNIARPRFFKISKTLGFRHLWILRWEFWPKNIFGLSGSRPSSS